MIAFAIAACVLAAYSGSPTNAAVFAVSVAADFRKDKK